MSRHNPKLIATAWMLFVLSFITAMYAGSYYLTASLYTLMHLQPPDLLRQIINLLLGLLVTGFLISGISYAARANGWVPERNVFNPIIEAMQKIAKGDFSVRLDDRVGHDNGWGTLVHSVNTMALELNQMETMRQEFISNVSHEIQSPLTSIRGFAQALQNEQLSRDERAHYLGIIEAESMRLSKLSDNLLALAALEADSRAFEPTYYRLDRQVRDIILACEPQWREKALELEIALDEVAITADRHLLSQVWINLIHNSIKFTPPGGRISIELCQQDAMIAFTITDTGIGIAEQDQPHVFERFFKADRSRQQAKGGSGLGLAIASKIIALHQGSIGLTSSVGSGTTFIVRLPATSSQQSALS